MIYSPEDFSSIQKCKKHRGWKRAILAAMWNENTRAEGLKKNRSKTRKPRNSRRNRGFAVEEMTTLKFAQPAQFQRMFRMDGTSFDELVELLDPLIKRQETYAINSSGSPISTTTRLAVTLRWLSG